MGKRGMLFNNPSRKRGDISHTAFFILFELLLVSLVTVALISYANRVKGDTYSEKDFLSKDMAMLVNTLHFSPGNIDLYYYKGGVEFGNYRFDFMQQKAIVGEEGKGPKSELRYPYGEDKGVLPVLQGDLSSGMFFNKYDDALLISDAPVSNTSAMSCSNYVSSEIIVPSTTEWIIDPGHGGKDEGYVAEELKESEINLKIAKGLRTVLSADTTRETDTEKTMQQRVSEITDKYYGVISIHAGIHSNKLYNFIRIYVSDNEETAERSRLLACLIANNLVNDINTHIAGETEDWQFSPVYINGAAVIPVNLRAVDESNPLNILKKENIGVYIEVGNIQAHHYDKLIASKKGIITIRDAIKKGVDEFKSQ